MSGWFAQFLELIESNCKEILTAAANNIGNRSVSVSGTFGQPGVARVQMFLEKLVGERWKVSTRCFYVTRMRDGGALTSDQQRSRLREAILATQQEMRDPADFDDDVSIEHDREHFVVEI